MTADWVSAGAAIVAILVAVSSARWTILDAARARDFATIEAIRSAAQESSGALFEKLQEADLSDAAYDFYAKHFLDVLEFAAHAISSGLVSGRAKTFLVDWLKAEASSIKNTTALKDVLLRPSHVDNLAYSELLAFCAIKKIHLA